MESSITKKYKLSEQVTEKILLLMEEGKYQPGDKLPSSKDIAYLCGVGMSTVREALHGLAMMNVVDIRPGIGVFLKNWNREVTSVPNAVTYLIHEKLTSELLEARNIIETEIAVIACDRAAQEDFDNMAAENNALEQAIINNKSTAEPSANFHVALAHASHNSVLIGFMESISKVLILRGKVIDDQKVFHKWELQSHREILDAIRNRDKELARKLTKEHLGKSAEEFIMSIRKGKEVK